MTSGRTIMLRAIVALCGIGFAVLLAEVALRLSGRRLGLHTDTMFTVMRYDRRFGWLMKPGVEQRVDFVDVEGLAVRSNSLGFRDAEFVLARHAGSMCRVLFLGDSFTWGLGVTEDERFSSRAARPHPTWESLNFGMPGFGTDQSLLLFEQVAAQYRPDVVVYTMYQNDYVDNAYDIRYGRSKPYFERSGDTLLVRNVPVPDATFWSTGIWNRVAEPYHPLFDTQVQRRSRIVHWIGRNSALARAVYTGGQLASREAGTVGESAPAVPDLTRALTPQEAGRLGLATAILARMARHAEAGGSKFVVYLAGSTLPLFEQQRRRLETLGVAVEDVTTTVIGPTIGGVEAVLFPFNGHWTPAAHAAVGSRMSDWIAANGCSGVALGS